MAKKKQNNVLFRVTSDSNVQSSADSKSTGNTLFSVDLNGKVSSIQPTVKLTSEKTKGTTPKKEVNEERKKELQKGFLEQRADENIWGIKKLGSGLLKAGTGAVDSVLQETQSDLQKGAQRDQDWYNKNALLAIGSMISPSLAYTAKRATKEFDKEYQKKNFIEKTLDNINDIKETLMPPGLKEAVRSYGTFDKQILGGKAPENIEKLSEAVNKPSEDFSKSLDEEGKRYSGLVNFLGGGVEQVGHMVPSIATTAITKDPNLGLAALGISAKGSSTREALNKGADLDTAINIGNAKALTEVATEKMFGGINMFGKKLFGPGVADNVVEGLVNKGIKQPLLNFLVKQGLAIGEETVEELVSNVVDNTIDKFTTDPNQKVFDVNETIETIKQTALTTILLNLLGGGYSPNAYNQNLSEIQNEGSINQKFDAYKQKISQNENNVVRNEATQNLNNQLNDITNKNNAKSEILNEVIEDANLSTELDNLTADEISEQINRDQISEPVKTKAELMKEQQLKIINQFNPAREGSNQTWVRNTNDIKTLDEALNDGDWSNYDDYMPDLTKQDIQNAIKKGEITVYSSTPIEQGAFITPSQMEAQSYAGNGQVYSKTVPINDVAWLDPTQGQYAKIPNEIKTYNQDTQMEKSKILNETPQNKTALGEKITKYKNKARYDLIDHLAPIYDMSRKAKNPTLYYKADAIQSADALAQNMLGERQTNLEGKAYNNFTDMKGNKVSMGFEKAWDLYKDIPTEAKNAYLVNMRNIDNLKQGVNQFDISYKDSVNTINKLQSEYSDINKWAENIWQYNYNQLQNMVDGGGVSQEQANEWMRDNPHYVRIQRNLNKNGSAIKTSGRNVKVNNQIQKVKGSTLEILPIKETTAKYTQQVIRSIRLNQFGQEYAKTVGVDIAGEPVSNIEDMFGTNNDVLKKTEDGYTFTIYDKGRAVTVPINEDIYKALQTKDIRTVPVLSQLAKGQRNLITNKNPYFAISNAVRDFGDMMLYSKFPALKTMSTYAQLFSKRTINKNGKIFGATGPEWVEFYQNTGNLSSSIFQEGKFKGKISKAIDKFDVIENANDFIESMPRIAEFANTIDANGYMLQNGELVAKPGVNPTKSVQDTLAEAAYNAADVTVNFKRGGTWAKNLDRNGATFLNASIQGVSKLGRTISEAIGDARNGDYKAIKRVVTRAMTLGVAPAILSSFMYKKDKDYEDLPDYVKDQYYLIKIKGTDQFIRIPKGRAVSIFEGAASRTGRFLKGDKKAFDDYDELIMNQIAPNNPLESNVLAPLISVANNKSWTGNKIVNDYLSSFDPDLQYDAKTSEISKGIAKGIRNTEEALSKVTKQDVNFSDIPFAGDFINKLKSPKNLDYLIDQYSGVIGDVVLPGTTNYAENEDSSSMKALINPFLSKFTTSSTLNNKTYSEYSELKDKVTKKANRPEATNLDKAKSEYIANKYGETNQTISELYAKQRAIQDNKKLSDSEKYKQNKAVQKEINDYMKKVIKNVNEATEKNGVVKIGDKVYTENKDNKMKALTDKKVKAAKEANIPIEKYAIADAAISEMQADKNSKGETISGSKKKKAISYLKSSGYNEKEIKAIVEAYGWKY